MGESNPSPTAGPKFKPIIDVDESTEGGHSTGSLAARIFKEVELALGSADENTSGYLLQNDVLSILIAVLRHWKLADFDAKSILARAEEDPWHRYSVTQVLRILEDDLPRLPPNRGPTPHEIAEYAELTFREELISTARNIMDCVSLEGFTESKISDVQPLSISRADFLKCLRNRSCIISSSETYLLMSYVDQNEDLVVTIEPPALNPYTLGGLEIPSLYWKLLQMRIDCLNYSDTYTDVNYIIKSLVTASGLEKDLASAASLCLSPWEARNLLRLAPAINLPSAALQVLVRSMPINASGKILFKDFAVSVTAFTRFFYCRNILQRPSGVSYPSSGSPISLAVTSSREISSLIPGAASLDVIERSLTGYISRLIWAEHGRGSIDVDIAGSILMNAPLKDGLSRDELLGLAAELEYDEPRKTRMSPVEHVRKWLPYVLSLRSVPLYANFNKKTMASLIHAEDFDLNKHGISPTHLQSPKSRLNRSSTALADGKRMIRRVETISNSNACPAEGGLTTMSVSEKALFIAAQTRRTSMDHNLV